MVGLLRSEGVFQINNNMGSMDNESNSGSYRWVFKGLFDRRYSLIWIYFRLFTFERDILQSLGVAVGMG